MSASSSPGCPARDPHDGKPDDERRLLYECEPVDVPAPSGADAPHLPARDVLAAAISSSTTAFPQPVTLVDVWLPLLAVVGALAVLVLFLLVRRPQVGFLGAWCFITLSPTSSFVPIATEVGAERRMYLPLAGLVVLVVLCAYRAWTSRVSSQHIRHRRRGSSDRVSRARRRDDSAEQGVSDRRSRS